MTSPKSTWRADLALAGNTVIWGSTFVLVKRALEDVSALFFIAVRFSVASLIILFVFRRYWKREFQPRLALPGGILAGVCLFAGYAFQTAGLKLTTPPKSAFITGLAVVLVPLLNAAVYRVTPHLSEGIGVLIATLGMGLLTLAGGTLTFSRGDFLTLLCAIAFTCHIVVLGHFSRIVRFEQLAVLQLATTAILAASTCWWLEKPFFRSSSPVWLAWTITTLFSTALAFTVQAWAQQIASATRSALIFALEPVVAWIVSYLLTGEGLPPAPAFGAVLILAGILVAELKPIGVRQHPSE